MEAAVNTVYMSLDVYDNMTDVINNQQRKIEELSESENKFAEKLNAISDKVVCTGFEYCLEKRISWDDILYYRLSEFNRLWGDVISLDEVKDIYTMELNNLIKQDKEELEEIEEEE